MAACDREDCSAGHSLTARWPSCSPDLRRREAGADAQVGILMQIKIDADTGR
jgi:hypothetical protein